MKTENRSLRTSGAIVLYCNSVIAPAVFQRSRRPRMVIRLSCGGSYKSDVGVPGKRWGQGCEGEELGKGYASSPPKLGGVAAHQENIAKPPSLARPGWFPKPFRISLLERTPSAPFWN